MKKLFALFCLFTVLADATFAQTKDERAAHADQILVKARKIDLLNQILPVGMTKKQLNEVLGAVEKVRRNVDKQELLEFGEMVKLEAGMDAAIKAGLEKGELPSHEFVIKISKTFHALDRVRQSVIYDNEEIVRTAVKKVLNEGQIKAAANAIEPTYFDPSIKPEELTTAKKLDVYIRVVLLDPNAYSVLTELFKNAKN